MADAKIEERSKISKFDRSSIRRDGARAVRRHELSWATVDESVFEQASQFETGLRVACLGVNPEGCDPITKAACVCHSP